MNDKATNSGMPSFRIRHFAFCLGLMLAVLVARGVLAAEPRLVFENQSTFAVVGLSADVLAEVGRRIEAKESPAPLSVHVVSQQGQAAAVAMAGTCAIDKGVVRFRPRFPLEPGVSYRVVFTTPSQGGEKQIGAGKVASTFSIPGKPAGAATVVSAIYPSGQVLPENQLRFYVHFSAPMRQGEAYRHVHLRDDQGKEIPSPFLELGQELWDPESRRFTLLIHPGRIKRGVKLREELGPVLEAGKRYTLEVDGSWRDADGRPLAAPFRKIFQSGEADHTPIEPANWKLGVPAAGSRDRLEVRFPKSLDRALADRLIWVEDSPGHSLAGRIEVGKEEKLWYFTPAGHWKPGRYQLAVDSVLEDSAGNRVGRPFEIDVLDRITRKLETRVFRVPFEVRRGEENSATK